MLSIKEKAAYGLGAFGKDFAITTVFMFLMFYFTDTVGLNPAFVGTLFLVARLWDAFNDPIMGMIVDNTRNKFGKFKIWIAIGTVLNSIVLLFLFYQPPFISKEAMYIYVSVFYILWGMTYTMMDIPFWSMVPVVAKTEKDRVQISSILRFGANSAWMLMGIFGLKAIEKISGSTNAAHQGKGYFVVAIVLVVVFLICELIMLKVLKKEDDVVGEQKKVSFKEMFNIITKNDQALIFIAIVFLYNCSSGFGAELYFYTYIGGNKDLFITANGVGGIVELIAVFSLPFIHSKLGIRKTLALACTLIFIGAASLLIFSYGNLTHLTVFISKAISKFGTGIFYTSTLVMLSGVVDYAEKKNGSRNESIYFSVQTLLVKSSSAFTGWILGVALAVSGYVANGVTQNPATITTIRILMTISSMLIIFAVWYVDRKYFKLHVVHGTNKTVMEIENETK